MIATTKGYLGIVKPEFKKAEAEVFGGIARSSQRTELIEVKLVLCYDFNGVLLVPGDAVILKGEAGLQPFAKMEYRLEGIAPFVLCPENQILGYRRKNDF